MSEPAREMVDRIGRAMASGDLTGIARSYSADASVVSFARVASGRDEIRDLYDQSLTSHGLYEVMSIDQFREAGPVVIWDATVQTSAGFLQTTHVIVRDSDGLIQHHVPGVRGYWGM